MYIYEQVIPALKTLVGFTDGKDFEGTQLPTELTTSDTGRYYQKEHAMITLNNLKRIAPKPDESIVTEYTSGTQFYAGDYLKHNGTIYKIIQDVKDVEPPNTTYYEVYNPLVEYLKTMEEIAIRDVLDFFVENKITKKVSNGIIRSGSNYKVPVNKEQTDKTGFMGMQINMSSKHVKFTIHKIAMYLNTASTFDIYVYREGTKTPVTTKNISHTGTGMEQLDVNIQVKGNEKYYVGFYTDDLSSLPYRLNFAPNIGKASSFPFVADYNIKGEFIADENINWLYTSMIGMVFTSQCDITDFIIEQKKQFTNAIIKQFTYNILNELLYNPERRVNSTSRASEEFQKITYDIENITGMQLQKTLYALHINISNLDTVCFKAGKGIKYKTVS